MDKIPPENEQTKIVMWETGIEQWPWKEPNMNKVRKA